MAQSFDEKRLVTTGEAVPVAEQVERVLNSGRVGNFSASRDGMLIYHAGTAEAETLAWYDRSGKELSRLGTAAGFQGPFQLSPDGKSLTASLANGRTSDVWIVDLARDVRTRLTFANGSRNGNPIWSPDGRSIVFFSNRKGHNDLYRKSVDGSGSEELLYADDFDKSATSWSPDGKFLLFQRGTGTGLDIWGLDLPDGPNSRAPAKAFPVVQTPFNDVTGRFSPDGKWITYQSEESGRYEIYVMPFSRTGTGGKRQISSAGGIIPRWRNDGRGVFYIAPDSRLMEAEVTLKNSLLEVGQIRPVFSIPDLGANRSYDVSADGQHFLHPTPPQQNSLEPVTIIENWTALVRR